MDGRGKVDVVMVRIRIWRRWGQWENGTRVGEGTGCAQFARRNRQPILVECLVGELEPTLIVFLLILAWLSGGSTSSTWLSCTQLRTSTWRTEHHRTTSHHCVHIHSCSSQIRQFSPESCFTHRALRLAFLQVIWRKAC